MHTIIKLSEMNYIGLINDELEIRGVCKSASDVKDLFKAYNIQMEEEEDIDDQIMVPIVEMSELDDVFIPRDCASINFESGPRPTETSKTRERLNTMSSASVKFESNYKSNNQATPNDSKCLDQYGVAVKCEPGTCNGSEEDDKFRCDLCGAGFRIKHSITKHKRVIHRIHQFTCMFCNKSYPLKRNLLEHIPTHRGPHGFKCKVCNKVRPNYISIQRHLKTHAEKSIPCPKCEAKFKTKWELRSHEVQHMDERQFDCVLCSISFANPSKMKEHMTTQHGGHRPFKCDNCTKEFATLGSLNNHKKLHVERKQYKCQYCSMKFVSAAGRKKHTAVHERERRKPFSCPQCHKKYTSTTSLAVHRLKFHSSEESVYQCHYCKGTFESKVAISEHMAEHDVQRPHSCHHPDCTARYRTRRELYRHQQDNDHMADESDQWVMPEPEVQIVEQY